MTDLFFNKTVTIWNCTEDELMEDETWYPTVLENVRFLASKGANITASGLQEADSAKLHIMLDNHLSKPYKKPIEWSKESDKSTSFTLCKDKDFFVLGNVSAVAPTSDFFQYMKSNYDDVYKISTVDEYQSYYPHLEVGGK